MRLPDLILGVLLNEFQKGFLVVEINEAEPIGLNFWLGLLLRSQNVVYII